MASLIHRSSYLFLPSSIITLGHRCSRRCLFNRYRCHHAGTHDVAVRVRHGCKQALAAANFIGHPSPALVPLTMSPRGVAPSSMMETYLRPPSRRNGDTIVVLYAKPCTWPELTVASPWLDLHRRASLGFVDVVAALA